MSLAVTAAAQAAATYSLCRVLLFVLAMFTTVILHIH